MFFGGRVERFVLLLPFAFFKMLGNNYALLNGRGFVIIWNGIYYR